jgi:phosphatidate cytidylyltransferase
MGKVGLTLPIVIITAGAFMADSPGSKARTFASRLGSTVLLWLVMAYALWAGNSTLFLGLAAFFGFATGIEYFRLLRSVSFPKLGSLVCLIYWVIQCWRPQQGFALDLGVLAVTLQLSFLLTYRHALEGSASLLRIFSTVAGVFYSTVCFSFLIRIADFPDSSRDFSAVALLLYCIMVTKFSDMGAYAIGSMIGKHKMIPHISPAKSWEGLGGAFLGGLLAASGMLALAGPKLAPLTWTSGLLLAPVLVIVAVSGDLAESVLKRCVSIKDSGQTLPGIGGILDLTDSLLFTAPLCYAVLCWLA